MGKSAGDPRGCHCPAIPPAPLGVVEWWVVGIGFGYFWFWLILVLVDFGLVDFGLVDLGLVDLGVDMWCGGVVSHYVRGRL